MAETDWHREFGVPLFDLKVRVDDEPLEKVRRDLALYAWLNGRSSAEVKAIAGSEADFFNVPDKVLTTGRPAYLQNGPSEPEIDRWKTNVLVAEAFKNMFLAAFQSECAERLGLELEFVDVVARPGSAEVDTKVRAKPAESKTLKIAGLVVGIWGALGSTAAAVSKYPEIKDNVAIIANDARTLSNDIQTVAKDTLDAMVLRTREFADRRDTTIQEKISRLFVKPTKKAKPSGHTVSCTMTIEAQSALRELEAEASSSSATPDNPEEVRRRRKELEGLPEQLRRDQESERFKRVLENAVRRRDDTQEGGQKGAAASQ